MRSKTWIAGAGAKENFCCCCLSQELVARVAKWNCKIVAKFPNLNLSIYRWCPYKTFVRHSFFWTAFNLQLSMNKDLLTLVNGQCPLVNGHWQLHCMGKSFAVVNCLLEYWVKIINVFSKLTTSLLVKLKMKPTPKEIRQRWCWPPKVGCGPDPPDPRNVILSKAGAQSDGIKSRRKIGFFLRFWRSVKWGRALPPSFEMSCKCETSQKCTAPPTSMPSNGVRGYAGHISSFPNVTGFNVNILITEGTERWTCMYSPVQIRRLEAVPESRFHNQCDQMFINIYVSHSFSIL